MSHPLLDELKGIISRLKTASQPIKDGHSHLVPFCETLEMIFRNGLKQPNSWFGLNRQDYWSWIEPLQDYYFNLKQNPLLSQFVQDIASSSKIRSVEGRGRCFIRVALSHKIISVPIEHLARNARLTQYWYMSGSVIASPELRGQLIELLFEVTELDFKLDYHKSSFLDETWIIPVYQTYRLPPLRTLDIVVAHVESRELIVHMDRNCLACKAGVEIWDILDELCGVPVHLIPSGKIKAFLTKNSDSHTDITVVKKYLADGSPFAPVFRRQMLHTHRLQNPPPSMWIPEVLKGGSSPLIRTEKDGTHYKIVYLGLCKAEDEKPNQSLLDGAITHVLNGTRKPEEVLLTVTQETVSLLSTEENQVIIECSYHQLGACGRATNHKTCMAFIVLQGKSQASQRRIFTCYICEAPSAEMAHCICAHIAKGFTQKRPSSPSSPPNTPTSTVPPT